MKNSFQIKAADVFVTCGDFTASVCRLRNTSAVSIDYKVGEVTTALAAGAASGAINVSNSTREVSVRRADLNSSAVSVLIEWGLTADEAYELASDPVSAAHNTAPDSHADIRTLIDGKQDSLTISDVGEAMLALATPSGQKIPRVNADGSVVLIDAPRWYASDDGPPNAGPSLSWVADGDANGVVYLAGSQLAHLLAPSIGGPFINPSISGGPLAMLRSSDGAGNASQLTDRAPSDSYSTDTPNSWICCDLGAYALKLKSYSLRHQELNDVDYIRTWRIQGSNEVTWSKAGVEAAEWVDLDVRSNDTTISTPSGWGHFSLPEQAPSYRYIRLIQDGPNSENRHYLAVAEWEFYGTLTTTPRPAGSAGWARNSKLIDDATAWMPYYAASALTDGTPI